MWEDWRHLEAEKVPEREPRRIPAVDFAKTCERPDFVDPWKAPHDRWFEKFNMFPKMSSSVRTSGIVSMNKSLNRQKFMDKNFNKYHDKEMLDYNPNIDYLM